MGTHELVAGHWQLSLGADLSLAGDGHSDDLSVVFSPVDCPLQIDCVIERRQWSQLIEIPLNSQILPPFLIKSTEQCHIVARTLRCR